MKCRRKLSFLDDPVADYSLPAAAPSALIALSDDLATAQKDHQLIWNQVAGELDSGVWGAHLFENPLINALQFHKQPVVIAAIPVLKYLVNTVDLQPELVTAVFSALCRFTSTKQIVEPLAHVVRQEQWSRVYTSAVAKCANQILLCAIKALESPELDVSTWDCLISLVSLVTDAGRRVQLDASDFELTDSQARHILSSFERMAPRGDSAATQRALASLKAILVDKGTAAVFATENGAAVLGEVSAVFAKCLPIQHACVDLLVGLASPNIVYYCI